MFVTLFNYSLVLWALILVHETDDKLTWIISTKWKFYEDASFCTRMRISCFSYMFFLARHAEAYSVLIRIHFLSSGWKWVKNGIIPIPGLKMTNLPSLISSPFCKCILYIHTQVRARYHNSNMVPLNPASRRDEAMCLLVGYSPD